MTDFAARHALALDTWELRQKRLIAEQAALAMQQIDQRVAAARHRVRLACAPAWLASGVAARVREALALADDHRLIHLDHAHAMRVLEAREHLAARALRVLHGGVK